VAQAARRKSRKGKGRKRGAGFPWGTLVVALVCAGILAALFVGARHNRPGEFGSGIRSLLQQEDTSGKAPKAPAVKKPPKPPPKVELDYHKVLPNMDDMMTGGNVLGDDESAEDDQPNHSYILQAGAYRAERDAQEMKAKLALVGFEAAVQRVSIQGKGTYYRVRMGPYHSKRKVLLDRKRLREKGFSALAVRLD
jgi:cell division protein FtsN